MDEFHPNSRERTIFPSIQIQGEHRGGYKLPGRSQEQVFHGRGAMAERKDGHDAAAAASTSTALDGVEGDGKTAIQDDAWLPSDSFVHEPPVLKVMQPKCTTSSLTPIIGASSRTSRYLDWCNLLLLILLLLLAKANYSRISPFFSRSQ
jgi:hypothetical protein